MWEQLLIGVVSGLLSGVIVSLITSILIERKIKKHDEFKNQLLAVLKFFYRFESKTGAVTNEEISKVLIDCRVLFKHDNKLMTAFKSIDVSLSNTLLPTQRRKL